MKLASFSILFSALTIIACAEPKPKPVRPSIDPLGKQEPLDCTKFPTSVDCKKDTPNPPPTGNPTGSTNTTPPVAQPPVVSQPTCAAGSVCKDFTAKEIALCKLYSADPAPCLTKQWGTSFYESISASIAAGKVVCTVNGADVNLRSQCSLESSITKELIPNATVVEKTRDGTAACTGTDGANYIEVKWGSKTGFIYSTGLTCL